MLRRRSLLGAMGASAVLAGCPKTDQSLILVGGDRVDAATIDQKPLEVLPSGGLMVAYLDAAAMFRTAMKPEVLKITQNVLPLGRESNLVPERDIQKIYGAAYAMQGADFCAVLQGNFDVASIRAAAGSGRKTVHGAPLVRTQYGDHEIYTVANMGFAVLTPHTILSGTETALRRALDRLRFGRMTEDLAPWMHDLLDQAKRASFALVGDLSGQPSMDAVATRWPFLADLRMLRVLGNFDAPGVNIVGSFTYGNHGSAEHAGKWIQDTARFASLLAFIGIRPPKIELSIQKANVAFATQADSRSMNILLAFVGQMTRPQLPGKPY